MQSESHLQWEHILKKEPKLDFLFNITIPAAKQRKSSFHHLIIVCEYAGIREMILEKLSVAFDSKQCYAVESIGIKPGDVAAVLTGLCDNGVIVVENGATFRKMQPAAKKVLSQALLLGYLEVEIGKGTSAQTHRLDLPKFSVVAFFENSRQIEKNFCQAFDEIIEVHSFSPDELCAIEVRSVANEIGIDFDNDAIVEIVRESNGDYRQAGRYVRWIRDYMLVKNDLFKHVHKEYVSAVIAMRQ